MFSPTQDYDLLEPNSITYFCNCAGGELDFFWEGVEFLTFYWEDHPSYVYFDEGNIVVSIAVLSYTCVNRSLLSQYINILVVSK